MLLTERLELNVSILGAIELDSCHYRHFATVTRNEISVTVKTLKNGLLREGPPECLGCVVVLRRYLVHMGCSTGYLA
jgi:hypothetical protein